MKSSEELSLLPHIPWNMPEIHKESVSNKSVQLFEDIHKINILHTDFKYVITGCIYKLLIQVTYYLINCNFNIHSIILYSVFTSLINKVQHIMTLTAFAGNARNMTGVSPLNRAAGPSSFITCLNTSRTPLG